MVSSGKLDLARFLKRVIDRFPELRDSIDQEKDLPYCQVHCLFYLTEDLLQDSAANTQTLAAIFSLVDESLNEADEDLFTYLLIGFVENLEFGDEPESHPTWSFLSPDLQEAYLKTH